MNLRRPETPRLPTTWNDLRPASGTWGRTGLPRSSPSPPPEATHPTQLTRFNPRTHATAARGVGSGPQRRYGCGGASCAPTCRLGRRRVPPGASAPRPRPARRTREVSSGMGSPDPGHPWGSEPPLPQTLRRILLCARELRKVAVTFDEESIRQVSNKPDSGRTSQQHRDPRPGIGAGPAWIRVPSPPVPGAAPENRGFRVATTGLLLR